MINKSGAGCGACSAANEAFMEGLIITVVAVALGYAGVRYGFLEWKNRRRFRALHPVLSKKTFMFSPADMLFHRLSTPVILSLTKKNLKVIHALPFLSVRSIPLVQVKSFGMDTFLPWGSPLDKGRVINVILKDGKRFADGTPPALLEQFGRDNLEQVFLDIARGEEEHSA